MKQDLTKVFSALYRADKRLKDVRDRGECDCVECRHITRAKEDVKQCELEVLRVVRSRFEKKVMSK